jgi:hypothetical protein
MQKFSPIEDDLDVAVSLQSSVKQVVIRKNW